MKNCAFYLFVLVIVFSCGNDETPSGMPGDPSNLIVDILNYDDGSGIVVVSASGTDVTEYEFNMGDGVASPIKQSSGTYEYTYEATGSYTIIVKAFGSNGRFLESEQNIVVKAGEAVSIGEGYSTPISYPDMELIWNDEFNGTTLNLGDWSYDNGDGCPNLCGWGNNELEYYRPENSWVQNGVFTIEAREESFMGRDYTSTKILTRDKQAFNYGRIDIRAKLPKGQGIWPALWMLGQNQTTVGWPRCGEIDIMEMIGGQGRERTTYGNAYWFENNGPANNPKTYTLQSGEFHEEFHVFSIIKDEQKITWFVDDVEFHSLDITNPVRAAFHNSFFLIFNIAVGGNFPGSPDGTTQFPTQMQVDYVRVFKDL